MMGVHRSHLHKQGQHSSTKGFQLKTIMLISLNTLHQHQSQVVQEGSWVNYTSNKNLRTVNNQAIVIYNLIS